MRKNEDVNKTLKCIISSTKFLYVFFVIFLLIGVLIYKDYGVSYDETIERTHGLVNLKSVLEMVDPDNVPQYLDQYTNLETYSEVRKTYGIAMKIPLIIIEYICDFNMTNQQIYYMNHLYTFLIFFISSIYIYRVAKLLRWDNLWCLLTLVMYIISPRILADSFYNIKDSIFLSVFVINIFYLMAYYEKGTNKFATGLVLFTALSVNTRVIAAVPIFIGYIFLLLKDKKKIKKLVILAVCTILVYILVTPASWKSPVEYFISVVKMDINFVSRSNVKLAGMNMYTGNLPWYYLILTIVLTVPNIYIIFSAFGVVDILIKMVQKNDYVVQNKLQIMLWVQVVIIFLLDILKNPVKYNMWRQFYFVHFYICIFCVIGLKSVIKLFENYKIYIKLYIVLSIFGICFWIVKNHPYEYVYFNPLFVNAANETGERDYWLVSYQNALKSLSNDNSINVYPTHPDSVICFFGEKGWENYHLDRNDYGAEYKFNNGNKILYNQVYKLTVDNRDIVSIFKRKNYNNCKYQYYFNDSGKFIAQNDDDIKCEFINQNYQQSIIFTLPDNNQLSEMDMYLTKNLKLTEQEILLSDDGMVWSKVSSDYCLFNSNFISIVHEKLPKYVKVNYEILDSYEFPEFLINFYGEKDKGYDKKYDLSSNYNQEQLSLMYDGDIDTRWTSNTRQCDGMEVRCSFQKEECFDGIILRLGNSKNDYPANLHIYYKANENDWNEIEFIEDANHERYMFTNSIIAKEIKLVNEGNSSGYYWSINEMDFIKNSNVQWNLKDTYNILEDVSYLGQESIKTKVCNDKVWTSKEAQNSEMFIELTMSEKNSDAEILGFHMDSGSQLSDTPRHIEIIGSNDGINWNTILYEFESSNDYVFTKPENYKYYRIKQTGDDENNHWTIRQLAVLRGE